MATNKMRQAKKAANEERRLLKLTKVIMDFDKVHATGDPRPHYVPSGQAFTTGRKSTKLSFATRLQPHLRKILQK